MAEEPAPQGDRLALQQTTERFSSVLAESGLPRMPARVFAALLFLRRWRHHVGRAHRAP